MNTYGMLIIVMTIWLILVCFLIGLGYYTVIGCIVLIIIFSIAGYYYPHTRAWLSLIGTVFILGTGYILFQECSLPSTGVE